MIEWIFFGIAAIAVASTVMMITRTNAVHALLYLIVSLLAISVLFFMMGAPFAGVLEVIIYAGAIMVLFIFVIMMLNLGRESVLEEKTLMGHGILIAPAVMTAILLAEFIYVLVMPAPASMTATMVPAKAVGVSLYGTYLVGVELAGLVLLAGIIGAYHIGRTERPSIHRFLKGERK